MKVQEVKKIFLYYHYYWNILISQYIDIGIFRQKTKLSASLSSEFLAYVSYFIGMYFAFLDDIQKQGGLSFCIFRNILIKSFCLNEALRVDFNVPPLKIADFVFFFSKSKCFLSTYIRKIKKRNCKNVRLCRWASQVFSVRN